MKRRVAALVLVSALGWGSLMPAVAVAIADDDSLSTNLPVTEHRLPAEPVETPAASLLDLSLFGVIALGVLGLFWIRRHTSEL